MMKTNISYESTENSYSQSKTINLKAERKEPIKYNFTNQYFSNDIFSLAKAFLSISEMTNKKLQKLCYYAKAWHLALYDTNLITEQFQAWVHGAVNPALYQKYKEYGYEDIPKIRNVSGIPEDFIFFSKEIYESYGHLSGNELEKINHGEDPWINARGDCAPWEMCKNIIKEEEMKEYYRKMM
ncbi:MAG: Panacea domain-containing protein [Anaerostipes sp.]|jgi:uncharacterized phage-associated protein